MGAAEAEREATWPGALNQRAPNTALARSGFDPHCRDPWRQMRALREIGGYHRGRAEKRLAVMGDRRERYRRGVHVLTQKASDVVERRAVRFPPCAPNPYRHGVEKLGAPPQVGNGESKRH